MIIIKKQKAKYKREKIVSFFQGFIADFKGFFAKK